jgi:hypothetical protein
MKRSGYTPVLLFSVLAFLLVLSGCDDTLTDFNTNPNAPTSASPNNLLANAQRDLHHRVYSDEMLQSESSLYAQYTTQNFYPDQYASIDYAWEDIYNSLNDLQQAKALARQGGGTSNPANLRAVATITQVWAFHLLTDAYGDIPFAEALQGSENRSPAYTPQSDIYPALVDSLDQALSTMNPGASGPTGDLVLAGDMEQYQKLANGLKLRLAIRMSDVNPDMAESIITGVVNNATTLESNADNAYFQFSTSATHRNTFYENRFVLGRDDYDMTERFIAALQQYETDDPRLDAYAEQTSNTGPPCEDGSGQYAGFPFELEQAAAQAIQGSRPTCNASRPEVWWLGGPSGQGDAYSPIMYYDEVLFIKAEAAERGWISGDPEDYLERAIEASIDFYGAETEADISGDDAQTQAYISAVLNDYSSDDWRDVLGEQKWIAFYLHNIQGWSTWRRLDFDEWIGPPAGGIAGGELGSQYAPLRADYPDSEYNLNLENVTNAASSQFGGVGSENAGQQLWWDVNSPPPQSDAYQP